MKRQWFLLLLILTSAIATPALATEEANDWLVDHPQVRVGVPDDLAPLISISNDQARGFDVDVLTTITAGVPIEFAWTPCGSWSQCLVALKNKEIDVLTSMSYSTERAAYTSFTQRYWTMPWATLSLATETGASERETDVNQLRGRQIGVTEGYSVIPMLRNIEQTEVVEYRSLTDGIEALQRSVIDVYVDSLPIVVDELQQRPVANAQLSVLSGAPGEDLFIGVRSDYQPLVVILNEGIENLTALERQRLRRKWYGYELQRGWSDQELLSLGLKAGSVVVLLIAGVAFWNSRLRREVKLRKAAERRIRYVATHDELTGLPNRNLLSDRLEQAILQHQRSNKAFAMMFLDLDGFKIINDDFGHEYGDELLVQAAQRLTGLLRKSDTVCRYGGDEFVVLLPSTNNVNAALAVARKLVVHLARPYKVKSQTLDVSVSIGVAMFPKHGVDEQTLLRSADKAMYAAKAAGKNDVRMAG